MPVVLRVGPYAFLFYAADGDEPAHVHVKRDAFEAKLWLEPAVRVESSAGFARHELGVIVKLTIRHRLFLLERWHEFFGE